MLSEFKTHIQKQFPELKTSKFLLACSGGVDSVVLTHLCQALELDFTIAHCNFQLRGADSDTDEVFVKTLAEKLSKPFYVTHFNTSDYVIRNRISVQMAARELRYTWFTKLMQKNAIKTLITAHQADDDIETFLINLSRGTGINGLTGIPSKTTTISRPLLPFSRDQILAYAKTEKIKWREDISNSETKYLRNKIRHEIVPLLKELHPTFQENFKSSQNYLTDTAQIAKNHINDLKSELFISDGSVIKISIVELMKLYPQNTYLFELLKDYGFGKICDDISVLITGMSGKEVISKTHRLIKDREYLLLEALIDSDNKVYYIKENQKELTTPVHLIVEKVKIIEEVSENILYIDKDTLKYPLVVRKWQKGDYFYPFGMKGKKKLSKYFKDEKIDILSKEKQWLLCSGEEIIWVIGKRADNRYRITKKTRNSIKFIWNK